MRGTPHVRIILASRSFLIGRLSIASSDKTFQPMHKGVISLSMQVAFE